MSSSGWGSALIEAVLGPALSLLDAYPHAIAVAISDDGMPTSVPGQIPLPREQCVIPRGLQVFSHEGLGALAEAMVAAKRDGGGRARVRFSYPEGDFDGMVTAHFIDGPPGLPGVALRHGARRRQRSIRRLS